MPAHSARGKIGLDDQLNQVVAAVIRKVHGDNSQSSSAGVDAQRVAQSWVHALLPAESIIGANGNCAWGELVVQVEFVGTREIDIPMTRIGVVVCLL